MKTGAIERFNSRISDLSSKFRARIMLQAQLKFSFVPPNKVPLKINLKTDVLDNCRRLLKNFDNSRRAVTLGLGEKGTTQEQRKNVFNDGNPTCEKCNLNIAGGKIGRSYLDR